VQAQGLASTYTLHDTKLQAVTNAFGFIGLILDIIGAIFGVVNAILLQKSIGMCQKLLLSQPSKTNQRKQQLQDLMKLVSSGGPAALAGRAEIVEQLQREMARSKSSDSLPLQVPSIDIRPYRPFFQFPLQIVNTLFIFAAQVFLDRGQLPVALMSLGIGCFLIFVLCFAASSQPEPIWITCIAITAYAVVYSSFVMIVNRPTKSESIPLSLPLPGSNTSCRSDDKKEDFFQHLSALSEQLPRSTETLDQDGSM
jgi:hypothetical protein